MFKITGEVLCAHSSCVCVYMHSLYVGVCLSCITVNVLYLHAASHSITEKVIILLSVEKRGNWCEK